MHCFSEKDRALSTYDMLLMLLSSLAYFPSHLAPEDLCSKVYKKEQSADTANEDSEDGTSYAVVALLVNPLCYSLNVTTLLLRKLCSVMCFINCL